MRLPAPSSGMEPIDAIERIAPIVAQAPGEVVFATVVHQDGFIGDSECFVSPTQPKTLLPEEQIFYLAKETGAPAVLLTTKSSGPISELHECDVEFTRRLIDYGRSQGIALHEHVLVEGDTFRIMSQCTDLWA